MPPIEMALQEVILSHFIELLVALTGEDIAMQLVRGAWPASAEEETT